mmetsp:Transcript_116890/g.342298  ORF Transcript_116890/g.342298 Transcript_116890/m.342298 type:complete len:236 (+) Transcript_116890:196-903(+)
MRLFIKLPVFFSSFAFRCRSSSLRRSSSRRTRSASSRLRRSSSSRFLTSSSSRRRYSSSIRTRSAASLSAAKRCSSGEGMEAAPAKEPPEAAPPAKEPPAAALFRGPLLPGGCTRLPRAGVGLCEPAPAGDGAGARPGPWLASCCIEDSSRSWDTVSRPIFSSRPTSKLQTLPRSCSCRCPHSTSCLSARLGSSCAAVWECSAYAAGWTCAACSCERNSSKGSCSATPSPMAHSS